jgi:putative cofactor-binding repeat protein
VNGGTAGFEGCTFVQWDRNNKGKHAIQASKGSLVVQGCEFQEAKPQIGIGAGVRRAVVTGNLIRGAMRINAPQKNSIQIANNASDDL